MHGAFLLPMVFSLHASVKAPRTKDPAPPLNGVWNSLLFMMCNNGSGRHKVCSYYVIKTICVFPKQEKARWEGGEEKKEQQQQKKSQDWKCRACVVSRKLRLIQLSHKKPKKNVLWIQSLLNVLHVHFPHYLPIYIGFQMLAFLRAVEIFVFKIKIVSFLETIKPKKKKSYPHLHLQKFFTETRGFYSHLLWGEKKKLFLGEGPFLSVLSSAMDVF